MFKAIGILVFWHLAFWYRIAFGIFLVLRHCVLGIFCLLWVFPHGFFLAFVVFLVINVMEPYKVLSEKHTDKHIAIIHHDKIDLFEYPKSK